MINRDRALKAVRIRIKGRVQGVGFRPFVYNLAKALNLKGYVKNTSKGVYIELEGENIKEFLDKLTSDPPPLSRIESVSIEESTLSDYRDFSIHESEEEGSFTHISPDVSVCNDCLRELLDRDDRRYLYPFINCTNCGPRYSITMSLPYDRPNTTMGIFRMCPDCEREYNDPSDRRFHAQPNACPVCGPSLSFKLITRPFQECQCNDPLLSTINILKKGGIVAIKGLGGFHIACDASNSEAVRILRKRKRKSNKPFALMAPDLDIIKTFCFTTPYEELLLCSQKRPIILFRKRPDISLSEDIAPENSYLGFMLPYTPLHYLLFAHPHPDRNDKGYNFQALVMTSGNISEEPIIHDNNLALEKLSHLVDAFLFHNRDIFMRVDDSVIKEGIFIRRARGYVPEPVILSDDGPEVLGVGADLKNTFTLTKDNYAVMSQHIGDMENYETLQFFEEVLENLKQLYRIEPVAMGSDLHPGYFTTRWAEEQPLPLIKIQHHHAHIASVMAEHGIKDTVIGVAFDGSGYGTDGTVWGGEFLVADLKGFQRLAHLKPLVLPGGEISIKRPWRLVVAAFREIYGSTAIDYLGEIGYTECFSQSELENILKLSEVKELSPLSSGAGRFFDLVSALMNIITENTFEAEAAIALESLTVDDINDTYAFDIVNREPLVIDLYPVIESIVNDYISGRENYIISTMFHNTIIKVIIDIVGILSKRTGIKDIALSGGVFQNTYILNKTIHNLKEQGFNVFFHREIPPNDACISLGQACVVREMVR
ncbi:MAG: carbamoyltransferase HypF [Nitrospirae bacterium]|nr:carbamoyltransferase HypF [Nitrospirota bacterium]